MFQRSNRMSDEEQAVIAFLLIDKKKTKKKIKKTLNYIRNFENENIRKYERKAKKN